MLKTSFSENYYNWIIIVISILCQCGYNQYLSMTNKYLGSSFVLFTIATNLLIELIFPLLILSEISIMKIVIMLIGFLIFYLGLIIYHEILIVHIFNFDYNTKTFINSRTSIVKEDEVEDDDNLYEEEPNQDKEEKEQMEQLISISKSVNN